jgi:ABC-type transport system involved in multi-copper enzyme maturation permease subunit
VTALVAAEYRKLRTVRSFWGYLLALLALAGIGAAGTIGGATEAHRAEDSFFPELASVAGVSTLIAIVLGIVLVTGEFRHGTITPTFLVTPVRERVLAAKLAFGVAGGIALAVLALLVVAAVAVPWLLALGDPLSLDGDTVQKAAEVVLQAALWAALGVAIGAAVQGQVAALLGTLIWVLVAETLISALLSVIDLDRVARFLPNAALSAVVHEGADDRLTFVPALLVSLGWIALVGTIGLVRTQRTDVT